MFTTNHFILLGAAITIIVLFMLVQRKYNFSYDTNLKALFAVGIVSETVKILLNMVSVSGDSFETSGTYLSQDSLPFHMCSVQIIFVILLMFFFKNRERVDNSLQCAFLISLPLQALAFYIPIFSRVAGAVFFNFVCVLLPNALSALDSKRYRLQANMVAYIGLFAFYLYTMIGSVLVPYVPFWAV